MSNVAESDVLDRVLKLIESTLQIPAAEVDIEASMESFGVNSLIVMELMENIEKAFDVTLTPAQFSDIDTVQGLAELLESLLEEKRAEDISVVPDGKTAPGSTRESSSSTAALPPLQEQHIDRPASQLVEYVKRTFGVDLSGRELGSVERIAEVLLSDHAEELMRHYGLEKDTQGLAAMNSSPLVAIVGIGCRLPDAPNPSAFWRNLQNRKNSIREIPKSRWDWEAHYADTIAPGKSVSKWGALIEDVDCFDAEFFGIPAEEAATLDPQLRLLIEETYHSLEDAGIDVKALAGSRTGVFVGYEYAEYEQHLRRLNFQDLKDGPLFSSSSPSYYLANRVSHALDLCGPSESFNVNCASSAVAINRAYWSLLSGESEVAVAGAASLNLFADDYVAASQYGVLSPDGTSAVFDDEANGFTRGEGVAMVVLKRLEDAEKDNDRIYGLIRTCNENFRGATRNISEVKHESFTQVIKSCYEKAGVDAASVDYIEVDGYANKWADSLEYEGIKAVFSNGTSGGKHVGLGSVKGNIGNVESVSGVANVIKLALSLNNKRFPPTISKKKTSSFIDIDNSKHPLYIADEEISFEAIRDGADRPIRAGVNSFADSGTNVHILLEEYRPRSVESIPAEDSPQLFVISARTASSLDDYVRRYIEFLSESDRPESLADLAYTTQVGRQALSHRIAIVASSHQELLEKLERVRKAGINDNLKLDSRAVYYGRTDGAEKSLLAGLITPDMARTQLLQGLETGRWKEVAQLWVNGVDIPWEIVWKDKPARRVSLPIYPFAREKHWIGGKQEGPGSSVVTSSPQLPEERDEVRREPSQATEPEWYFYSVEDAAAQGSQVALVPAEKIELFLRQEAARHLKCPSDEVATDRDFFDLGLSSIGVAELIMKTDQLLGCSLSPNVLFEHSAIGTLSEYLAANYTSVIDALVVSRTPPDDEGAAQARSQRLVEPDGAHPIEPPRPTDVLVSLQKKGDKQPIFAVPGAGGSALSLQNLSQALGPKQPFYCLDPIGLDGHHAPVASVEAVAEFNIDALQSVQKKGPYRLLGYSNGGIIAFEMARQLSERGNNRISVTLVDTLAPSLLRRDPIEVMTVEVFRRFMTSLGAEAELTVEQLQAVPEEDRSAYLYECAADVGIELPRQQFVATFNVATASEQACRKYQPKQLGEAVDLLLLRATDGFRGMPADYGWNGFLTRKIRTRGIRADHFTILEQGPVANVAKQIRLPTGRASKRSSRSKPQAIV